ncbi:hypothetical protein IWW47_002225 [Coemansia sp. RSA 2052]|nr:hypothetical protein IWW47_002225 [Coemansia sp. RSA 2052]
MRCLKALPAANPPRNYYRPLLPYTGPGDFKPRDSNEPFLLDQALFVRWWDDQRGNEIDEGVSEPYYLDMLATLEAKKSESKSAIEKASGRTNSKSGGSSSRKGSITNRWTGLASSGVYNRQPYKHQHDCIFTWGLSARQVDNKCR